MGSESYTFSYTNSNLNLTYSVNFYDLYENIRLMKLDKLSLGVGENIDVSPCSNIPEHIRLTSNLISLIASSSPRKSIDGHYISSPEFQKASKSNLRKIISAIPEENILLVNNPLLRKYLQDLRAEDPSD